MNEHDLVVGAKIYVKLTCVDKLSLFEKMITELDYGKYSPTEVLEALCQRDDESSGSVGNGIYLPHVRLPELPKLGIAIATLRQPLTIPTIDKQPIKIVCLLLIPAEQPMEALKFMAELVGCLRRPDLYEELIHASNVSETAHFILELTKREALTLTAADLMSPPPFCADPLMPLHDVTRTMAELHVTTIPVVNDEKLVGEISCVDLFKLGIPDFFNRLASVSFIRYFDPFENYFAMEAAAFTRNVMKTEIQTFTLDSTLIEIVFAISVQKIPLIYVVDAERKLLGVITPEAILSRIVNF